MAETPKDIWFWGELLVQCGWRGIKNGWRGGVLTQSATITANQWVTYKSEKGNGTKRGGKTGDRERKEER